MATIQHYHRTRVQLGRWRPTSLAAVPLVPATPTLSPWEELKRSFVHWVAESVVAPLQCCGLRSGDLDELQLDARVRAEVNHHVSMPMERRYGLEGTLAMVREIYLETGEFVADLNTEQEEVLRMDRLHFIDRGETRTAGDWDRIIAGDLPMPRDPARTHQRRGSRARNIRRQGQMVSLFVARMVVMLRARLGPMAPTEANQRLVRIEYMRICRPPGDEVRIREHDMVMHEAHVLNAFFSELAFESVAHVRGRVPGWLRLGLGIETPQARPLAC